MFIQLFRQSVCWLVRRSLEVKQKEDIHSGIFMQKSAKFSQNVDEMKLQPYCDLVVLTHP